MVGFWHWPAALLFSCVLASSSREASTIAAAAPLLTAAGPDGLPVCALTPSQYQDSAQCRDFSQILAANGQGEVIFHAIFDFIRPSSLPLMAQQVKRVRTPRPTMPCPIALCSYYSYYHVIVTQVCRIMESCILPENFKILLHSVGAIRSDFRTAARFLKQYNIKYITWKSTFDTAAAQHARLHVLGSTNRTNQLILQADIDEFPDLSHLQTMTEVLLRADSPCDVFSGTLKDRMPLDGSLLNVSIGTDLKVQFPLQCDIKKVLEKVSLTSH
jgi:hypothetical protein